MKRSMVIMLGIVVGVMSVIYDLVAIVAGATARHCAMKRDHCLRGIIELREMYPSSTTLGDVQRSVGTPQTPKPVQAAPAPTKDEEYW